MLGTNSLSIMVSLYDNQLVRQLSAQVECDEDLQINCDGEPLNDKKYRFEVQKHRLRLMVPPTASDLFEDNKDLEAVTRQKEAELERQAPAKALEALEYMGF